jgi:hypothetical protein
MKVAAMVPLCLLAASALAADPKGPKTHFLDHSNAALIAADAAKTVMDENIPAKVWKLYPASKYVFLSQVEGGISASRTCVVTARVMLLPLTAAVRAVLFRPQATATAYDALPNASAEQCQALARDKLKEATGAVVSGLVKV